MTFSRHFVALPRASPYAGDPSMVLAQPDVSEIVTKQRQFGDNRHARNLYT